MDVGAANVGAVLMDGGRLLAKACVARTGVLEDDVAAAIGQVVPPAAGPARRITSAMLCSPRATEAVAERRRLRRVAVLRIGAPLTTAVPPLATWPAGLRDAISAGETIVRGGAEYDGRTATELDEDAVTAFVDSVAGAAEAVAITSIFSPLAPDQELAAAELVRRALGPTTSISLSHEIGTIGLLERENATVLNAALTGRPQRMAAAVERVLDGHGIDAELFFARNDGTLMALEHALGFPALMLGSGPASAMRGAAQASGVRDGVVVDLGATTTRVGALVNGLPRESRPPTEVAGVRINLPLPYLRRLPFGGATELSADVLANALAQAADSVSAPGGAPALVAVGGARALVPDELAGVGEVVRPADGDVAGAIGVATAPVSGHAELICGNRPDQLRSAIEDARADACARAVHAGADPDAVEVVKLEQVPLTYLVDPAVRVRVRAAGPAAGVRSRAAR